MLMGSAHGQGQGTWNELSWEANPSGSDSIARIFPEHLSFPRRREQSGGGMGLAWPTSGEDPQHRAHTPLPAPFSTQPGLRPLGGTSEQKGALTQQPSSREGPPGASCSPFGLYHGGRPLPALICEER